VSRRSDETLLQGSELGSGLYLQRLCPGLWWSVKRQQRHDMLLVVALWVSALVHAPQIVSAQPVALGISTFVDPCVPIDHDKFQQMLAVELGDLPVADERAETPGSATVSLTCVDGQIQLVLDDKVTRKSTTRRVDLASIDASARTRLMTLTVAELVLASWLEVRLAPTEVIEPVGPPPPAAVQKQASQLVAPRIERPRSVQLGAALEALTFSSAFRLIPCVALRLTVPAASTLALRVGAQVGYATLDGVLDLDAERHAVEVRLTIGSLLLALLHTTQLDAVALTVGLGARMGFARLAGVQLDDVRLRATQSYAPWLGPLATVALGYRISAQLQLTAALELGFVALRARAVGPDQAVVTELRDVWAAASLGVDWAL
jgi:hypothetical protein